MFEIFAPLLSGALKLIDKIVPDTNARESAKEEITRLVLSQESEVQKAIAEAAKAQAEVNLKEAESPSLFVSGWRPFIGWVCGCGFVYAFIMQPFINALLSVFHLPLTPTLDTGSMMGLLGGLLGLGTMRTVEKVQGVDRQAMSTPVLKR